MNGAGLAELLAEDVTLVTQRPAAASAVPSAESAPPRPLLPTPIEASLVGHRRSVSRLIVTPWDAASRHLVCLYLDSDSRQLCGVAKLPRRAWDVSGIRREGEALQELNERSSSLTGHVPQVRELCLGGRPFLLESALVGRAAGPSVASAETAALLDAALDFLRGLPVTGTTGDDPSWFDRLIEQPLRYVEELVALEMVPSLVDSTLRLLEPLRDIQMPLLFEHGDLSHPNLMLTADHQLAVIDWERSESRGLAFHDLCFLLQYVSEARNGAIERGSQLRAFDQAFTGADAWALPWLRRYAQSLGLSDTPVACLVLSTWARSAAGLLARTAPAGRRSAVLGGSATAKTELAMEVGADRDFQLWRHAVNRFEQLST
jgi:aminoglycoside phosphotransferase (APT) family kinase protein